MTLMGKECWQCRREEQQEGSEARLGAQLALEEQFFSEQWVLFGGTLQRAYEPQGSLDAQSPGEEMTGGQVEMAAE